MFVAPFHRRAERKDRSFGYKQRNALVRSINNQLTVDGFPMDGFLRSVAGFFLFHHLLTRIKVVPSPSFREIDRTVPSLVLAHGACHERRAEHPLVLDINNFVVIAEVHDECAHHRIVIQMYPSCHRIEVRHQTVAQLVVIGKRPIGRMAFRSNIPRFAKRPLTVGTIQGDETTELVPTRL